MKAAIMGAGAMGTVLGAFLTRNGFPVDLIDSYPAQVDALNKKGAGVVGCAELTVPVRALLPEQMEGVYDLVFLMVKQTNNEASLRALLPHLGENSTVCTLQNGVPELAVAEFVGRNRTVGGACRWGATCVEPETSELTKALSARTALLEIRGLYVGMTYYRPHPSGGRGFGPYGQRQGGDYRQPDGGPVAQADAQLLHEWPVLGLGLYL